MYFESVLVRGFVSISEKQEVSVLYNSRKLSFVIWKAEVLDLHWLLLGGRSRQAGKDRGQGERSIQLLIRCCSRPPSDGARNSEPGSLTGQLLSISFLGLNRATYNGSNDAFSSACYQQCSLDFDEGAYCMTNIIAFKSKSLHYWYILRLPQGKA